MNPWLVGVVWVLVVLDCALMGYRLEMGRSALLDKRRRHRLASLRAGSAGLIPLAVITGVAALGVVDGVLTAAELDAAMGRFIVVGGAYAALIIGASALCALPSVTVRTAASVVIFGPLTLLRPVVVVATVAIGVGPHPSVAMAVLGLAVMVPGVLIEPLLDRRIAATLVAAPAFPAASRGGPAGQAPPM